MGANGNRILMALLAGAVLVWTVRFLVLDGHLLFHKQDVRLVGGSGDVVVEAPKAAPICTMLAEASIDNGAAAFNANCSSCHQIQAEVVLQGPHLVGLVGRDIGSTDFRYSSALTGLPGNWDQETLNGFLFNPKAYAPGTQMNFGGWDNTRTSQRANVIAYLYSASGADLPVCEAADGDEEAMADEAAT